MKKLRLSLVALALTTSLSALAVPSAGIDPANFDKNVRAQDNLYQHVNGTWLKNNEIPADKAWYGAFIQLRDLSEQRVHDILDGLQKNPGQDAEAKKVADFYASYMNEQQVEKQGIKPLKSEFTAIAHLNNGKDLARYFGHLQTLGVDTPFQFYVNQDEKNSTEYLAGLYQGGTTLPDRDYYLKDEDKFKKAREAYLAYVETVMHAAGDSVDSAKATAKELLALETALAKAQRTKVALRDPESNYNKMSLADLKKAAPGFDWDAYFAAAEVKNLPTLNLGQPDFAKAAARLIADTPLKTWQHYLKFKLIDNYAGALPKAYVDAAFEFRGRSLAGTLEDRPRWKKAVSATNGALGEAVGKIYVGKYFTPEAKSRMDALVKNLLASFDHGIDNLTWMTPETKTKAKDKLHKYTVKIGYPDVWRDYSKLVVKADDLAGNMIRANVFEHERNVAKLGKPIDRTEWGMTPQTVNAYYNPNMNEIVFPAAILQPPFFNMDADDAVNYGGIGAVIGHEISHGFDDQGSQYDGDGNLKNWWSDKDLQAFKALTSKLVAQYNGYEPIPGHHVNGELTLGENIADLSGLAVAYKAYHASLNGKEAPVIDGLTGDQRFFMGFAQVWRSKMRENFALQLLLSDPHSPGQFRAVGPVENFAPFYSAFDVKPGDKMFKPEAERITIW